MNKEILPGYTEEQVIRLYEKAESYIDPEDRELLRKYGISRT